MDMRAPSFHAPEPRHLSFGELVNRDLQLADHLVVGQLPGDVKGQEFVFQPVIDEIFRFYASRKDTLYLIDHTLFQAGS